MSEKSEIVLNVEGVAAEPEAGSTPSGEAAKTYGGYATVEELVAAHEALKGSKEATPAAEGESTEGTEGGNKPAKEIPDEDPAGEAGDEGAAKEAVQNAGLDWDALNNEYAENGKLSEETYASLEQKGLPREAVDTYIAGKQAKADAYDNAVYGAAGGADEYAALIEWAKTSLTKDEKAAFNEAVTSGNAAKASLAVEALASRRATKRGTPPNLLNGNKAGTGVQPYKSRVEMTDDMRSTKYKTDPAFRARVVERLRVSVFNQ